MSAPADPQPGQVFRDSRQFVFDPNPAYEPGAGPASWRVDMPGEAGIYVGDDELPPGLVPAEGGEAAPAAAEALAEARDLVTKVRDEAARLPVAELRELAGEALAGIDVALAWLGGGGDGKSIGERVADDLDAVVGSGFAAPAGGGGR